MQYFYQMLLIFSLVFSLLPPPCQGVEEVDIEVEPQYWDELEPALVPTNFEAELGLLMSAQGFGTEMNLIQYLADYFQVGQSLRYFRQDTETISPLALHYDVSLFMRVSPFRHFKYSPYANISISYDSWRIDNSAANSVKVSYELGMNIYLTKYFGINLAHHELSFINDPPSYYWGRSVDDKNFGYDEVMFQFRLDDRLL